MIVAPVKMIDVEHSVPLGVTRPPASTPNSRIGCRVCWTMGAYFLRVLSNVAVGSNGGIIYNGSGSGESASRLPSSRKGKLDANPAPPVRILFQSVSLKVAGA